MLKRILKPILNEFSPTERFSFRVQNGVEIYEHESVRRYRMAQPMFASLPTQATRNPRLVVDEIDCAEGRFLAKTRSEISGLTAILKAVMAAR